jgi:hypothetical protein
MISACSGLDIVKDVAKATVLGPEKALAVDANVGQARTEGSDSVAQNANTAVSVEGGKTEEIYEGPVGQVINEAGLEIHELILLVLLAGWAIPSPSEMLLNFIRMLRNAKHVWLHQAPP